MNQPQNVFCLFDGGLAATDKNKQLTTAPKTLSQTSHESW